MDSGEITSHDRQVVETTQEFVYRLNALYGFYLDAINGCELIGTRLNVTPPSSDPADPDQVPLRWVSDVSDGTDERVLHQTTAGEFKARNAPGGSNFRLLSQNFIVFTFHLWEQGYRPRIAELLGKETKELQIPILVDFRLLRNDVIHNRGVLSKAKSRKLEAIKVEAISGLEVGQEISFSEDDIERLVYEIREALDEMVLSTTGTDPEFRKEWRTQ